ncbi:unnamed protein product [Penicillium salamii]|nr:unnamed protein product [Penicillium salamii]CAG8350498.1 unnamed protein product [Penicillium salamii]
MSATREAKDVIAALNLVRHPEKGYYIETFRDEHTTSDGRARSTCIYYLLEGSSGHSHWHRVHNAVEVWHYYAGAPLQLSLSRDDGRPVRNMTLGPAIWQDERPQIVIQQGEWQHAQSLGDWTLAGCSVSPGFDFEGFEMANPGWQPNGAFDNN